MDLNLVKTSLPQPFAAFMLDHPYLDQAVLTTSDVTFNQVTADSTVLFQGTTGAAPADWDATVTGDTGFLWVPEKGALRAGFCDTDAWDDANIGMRSVGMGVNAEASDVASIALGIDVTSSGRAALATGEDCVAAGDYTFATGKGTIAYADYSMVFGSGVASLASAEASLVGGWASVLDTGNAFVTANGDASFVFGYAIAQSGGTGTITSSSTSSEGTFVSGYAFGYGAGAVGTIYASLQGGFAQGYAYSTSGTNGIWSTAQGAFAQGYVVNGTIEATGAGAFAQGYVWITGYSVTAGGTGSFAHGAATTGDILASATNTMAVGDDVSATAANAYAFGLSVANSTASSFRVGWSAAGGMSLEDDVLELYGGVDIQGKHGDWCVYQSDDSGYNYFAAPVGIGTNSFASLLAISGTDRTSHFYYGADEDVYIRPGANTGDVFICDVVGSVCIGTTSQIYKLHVYHTENQVALFQSSDPYAMIELKDSNSGTYGPWLAAYGNELRFYADYDTISAYQLMVSATEVVVNDQSNENCDFRVEGNAYENLFFVNTDINRVTINYPATAALGGTNCLFYVQANAETDTIAHFSCDSSNGGILLIEGTSIGTAIVNSFGTGGKDVLQFITVGEETLRLNRAGAIFNYDYDTDHDFAVRGYGSRTGIFYNSGNNRVGIGTADPLTEFHFLTEKATGVMIFENEYDTGSGTILQIRRSRASGADAQAGDTIGRLNFLAQNSVSSYETMMYIDCIASNVTDGSEDATTVFYNMLDGSLLSHLKFDSNGVIVNSSYDADVDFEVRGDGTWTGLFVNAGAKRFAVGTDSPSSEFHFFTSEESPAFRIQNYNDAGNAISLQFRRSRASDGNLQDGDGLGRINFIGPNDAGVNTTFFFLEALALDVSDGAEDASLTFYNIISGTRRDYLTFDNSGTVFNEDNIDNINFRVEANGKPYMFFIHEQDAVIGINESSPNGDFQMHINSGGTQRTMLLETTNATGKQLVLMASGTSDDAEVMLGCTGDDMVFYAGGQHKMTLASNGYLGIGTGAGVTPDVELHVVDDSADCYIKVESEAASAAGVYFENTVCRWLWRVKAAGDLSLYNATATTDDIILINDTTSAITINQDVTINGMLDVTKRIHLTSAATDMAIVQGEANELDVDWDTQDAISTDYFTHSTSTNNHRITVDEDGIYHLICNLNYYNTTTNARNTAVAYIKVNGTRIQQTRAYAYDRGSSYGKYQTLHINTVLDLEANDYVEVWTNAYNIDGTLYLDYSYCEFHMWRL
jgi:hypothetical protein